MTLNTRHMRILFMNVRASCQSHDSKACYHRLLAVENEKDSSQQVLLRNRMSRLTDHGSDCEIFLLKYVHNYVCKILNSCIRVI